jgi:hypothetical protein
MEEMVALIPGGESVGEFLTGGVEILDPPPVVIRLGSTRQEVVQATLRLTRKTASRCTRPGKLRAKPGRMSLPPKDNSPT